MTETREVLYTTEQGEDIHVDEIGQWILQGSRYRPSQPTISDGLPAGGYEFGFDNGGPYVETLTPPTDAPLALPGCASEVVLAGIERFRKAEDRYAQFGMLYKRGILLYGPPGTGKTVTIRRASEALIAEGAVVLFCDDTRALGAITKTIRTIEPRRLLVVVYEDVERYRGPYEESLLSVLDGEQQVSNIIHIATTNYLDKLPPRLRSRPSRFDVVIELGMPARPMRYAFLSHMAGLHERALTKFGVVPDLDKWADETDGLSIAHLKELVIAVWCLGQDYPAVLERLRGMGKDNDD